MGDILAFTVLTMALISGTASYAVGPAVLQALGVSSKGDAVVCGVVGFTVVGWCCVLAMGV